MSLPSSLHVTTRVTLDHDFDMEARIEDAELTDTIKGMFFSRIDALLAEIDPTEARSRRVPFRDYPLSDYFRVVQRVADAAHPHLPTSEAVRRVAGADFTEFARSGVGRVALALAGDVRATLAKAGSLYGIVLKGSTRVESRRDGEIVSITFREYPGPVEVYPLGTLESCCRHFGVEWEIDVDVLGSKDANYTIRVLD